MTTEQPPKSPSNTQDSYPRGPQRDPNATATIYKMSSNENPLGCSAAVAAAVQAAAAGLGDYPPYTDEPLRQGLAELHGQRADAGLFRHRQRRLRCAGASRRVPCFHRAMK